MYLFSCSKAIYLSIFFENTDGNCHLSFPSLNIRPSVCPFVQRSFLRSSLTAFSESHSILHFMVVCQFNSSFIRPFVCPPVFFSAMLFLCISKYPLQGNIYDVNSPPQVFHRNINKREWEESTFFVSRRETVSSPAKWGQTDKKHQYHHHLDDVILSSNKHSLLCNQCNAERCNTPEWRIVVHLKCTSFADYILPVWNNICCTTTKTTQWKPHAPL